jgi:hypothetical protein
MNLKHIALYSRHNYKHSSDIWADIKKCLEADDYTPRNRFDMIEIISRNVAPLFSPKGIEEYTVELLDSTYPHNCWKCGYYTKGHEWAGFESSEVEYDYLTAVLYFFLSKLQRTTASDLGGLPEADKKVLPIWSEKYSI